MEVPYLNKEQYLIGNLAVALNTDIHFTSPDYYIGGAGDTCFSGNLLLILGWKILIVEELIQIAKLDWRSWFRSFCRHAENVSMEVENGDVGEGPRFHEDASFEIIVAEA